MRDDKSRGILTRRIFNADVQIHRVNGIDFVLVSNDVKNSSSSSYNQEDVIPEPSLTSCTN